MYKEDQLIEIKEIILNRLENGESLNVICKDKTLPSKQTIYELLKNDKQFSDNYARAKDVGIIKQSIDIMEIADAAGLTREEIQKATLQIETRKWLLSKLMPKKYGSQQQQTNVQVNIQPITGMKIIDIPEEEEETGQ